MRTALLLASLLLLTAVTSRAEEPTPETKAKIEELKKQLKEKRADVLKIETELAKLQSATPIEGKIGDKIAPKQGAFSYELRSTELNKSIPEGNFQSWINLVASNISEKENVPCLALANRFAAVSLTDDTGREYVVRSFYKPKTDDFIVPGNRVFINLQVPGRVPEAAKELYITLPGVAGEPPLKLTLPATLIKR